MAREAESSLCAHGERGNPQSAQPMPGLSKRAQALLTRPNSSKFAVALEPAGSALVRLSKVKRAI